MARKLIVEILGDSKSLERSFNQSTVAAKKFGTNVDTGLTRTANRADSAFAKIQGGLAGAFVGGVAASAAISGIKTVVGAASDLNEQITKNQQVFKSSAATVEAWSQTTAKSIGVSETAALEATGTFGNLFAAIGTAPAEAAKTSTALVKLAADLASFNNASIEDTLLAIRSGLVGEAEPLRKYGVLLSEARVQQVAMAQTGKDNAKALTVQEKAAARVAIIFKDTAAAQGDFERTSGGLANQQRILSAETKDLEANLGKLLLPTITELTTALVDITGAADTFLTKLKTLSGIKVPTIEIPFTTVEIPGTGGRLGGIVEQWFRHASPAGIVFNTADLVQFVAGWFDAGVAGATPALANEFRRSLGGLVTNALDTATSGPLDVKPSSKTVKGFGTGATPQDILGPLIKGISPALEEALLDAQISGNQKRIRSVLVKIRDSLTAALDDPRLKRPGRVKIKSALESIIGQIGSIDSAAQSAADSATAKATAAANKAAAKAKAAATAAQKKQRARFDLLLQNLTTKEDAAELTARFDDNIKTENKIQSAILKQIKVEGHTAELVGKLSESRQKEAKARSDRRQARQFRAIGLGAEGDAIIPTVANLKKQFSQLGDRIDPGQLSSKLRKQFAGVGRLLRGDLGKVTEQTRDAINELFRTIRGTFEDQDVFKISPATTALNKNKIVEGLGLDRHTEQLIKSRLSGFNAAGRKLSPAKGTTGAFGMTLPPINVHTTVNLDGQKVARNTTVHQGKHRRSNPPQKRGPFSGGVW